MHISTCMILSFLNITLHHVTHLLRGRIAVLPFPSVCPSVHHSFISGLQYENPLSDPSEIDTMYSSRLITIKSCWRLFLGSVQAYLIWQLLHDWPTVSMEETSKSIYWNFADLLQ